MDNNLDFKIIQQKDHSEFPGSYNGLHTKLRYKPISELGSVSDKHSQGPKRDTIETQFLTLNEFMKKEVSPQNNQLIYAFRQKQLNDRETREELKAKNQSKLLKKIQNPTKEWRHYLSDAESLISSILSYNTMYDNMY